MSVYALKGDDMSYFGVTNRSTQHRVKIGWLGVVLVLLLLFFGVADRAEAINYSIYTPNSGGTTNINSGSSASWWIQVSSTTTVDGAKLYMSQGTSASANVTLSLYSGVNNTGTLLASATLSSGFSTSPTYAQMNFIFATAQTLSPGNYYVQLTSTAPNTKNNFYFLKGLSNSILSSDGVTPISSGLAALSLTAPLTVANGFGINTASNGNNCTAQNVTITAKNGGNVVTAYSQNITLTTQSGFGAWGLVTGSGVFNQATPNSGVATYTYGGSDFGVAVFALTYSSGSSPITLKAYQTSNAGISDTFAINFYPSSFAITATTANTPPFVSNVTAGTGATMYITAYGGTDLGDATCGKLVSYTGTKTLKFWVNYVNPTTSAGIIPTINGTNINTTQSGGATKNIIFTNGQASVAFNYQDAGSINISAQDTKSGTTLIGTTGNFVVFPAQFVVTITSPTNPGATSATGATFVKAGAPFSATVQTKTSTGANTPNYGNETTPASVTLASTSVVLPVGGRNGSSNLGTIANGSSFTKTGPGLFSSSTLSFDEVGIFKFTASVRGGDYLGAGNASGPQTGNVGRFYPDHFTVTGNTPVFNAGCVSGGFTYMDQPFSYATSPIATVTAQAVAGTTTQNYTGSFWRLLTSSLNQSYSSNSSLVLNSASPTSSVTFVDNANGTGTYTFGSGTGFILQRISALSLTAPVTLEMKLVSTYTDQDGVTFASNPFVFGGTSAGTGITFNGGKAFYYGQMTLSNASGSELSPLNVPFQTQYYNGTDFQVNAVDNCTSFSNASWVSLTTSPNTLSTTASITPISNGIGAITLSTPSPAGTSGTVTVTTNLSASGANMPWLQFAWPNNASNITGQLIDSPSAIATFGRVAIPGGSQEVIYENEVVH